MISTRRTRPYVLGLVALALALIPLTAHANWRGHGGFGGGSRFGVFFGGWGGWPGYYPYGGYYAPAYYPYAYYYPPYYAQAYYPPPPPSPQVAVAPAPLASQGRDFRVFFEFDRATLTREGARVVREAADTYRRTGTARVEVVGYTDLAGTSQYNVGLSRRRADTVRGALVAQGVPARSINESWRGKQDPLVSTADGVRERQNRRVDIVLQ